MIDVVLSLQRDVARQEERNSGRDGTATVEESPFIQQLSSFQKFRNFVESVTYYLKNLFIRSSFPPSVTPINGD